MLPAKTSSSKGAGERTARYFVENNLSDLLAEEGLSLSDRARRRLEKSILRFDPHHPTPEEWLERCFDQTEPLTR